jgi:sulfide:quinone oxidoreductase
MTSIQPLRVVIAGGGIAGIEALLALHDLGEAQLELTLIAPNPDFVMRPLAVAEPFAAGHRQRVPLAEITEELGATLRRDSIVGVDDDRRVALCDSGDEVPYDVLVLATGGHQFAPYASGALTFGLTRDPMAYNGLLADLEAGYCRSVAFVVPPGTSWALPLYEVALMTARQVWSMSRDNASMTLITPEASPLAVFGPEASTAVSALLEEAGITVEAGVYADVLPGSQVRLTPGGRRLAFNRVVTLPLIAGPQLRGVPVDARGFVPVDGFGQVQGLDGVYCAGDAAGFPVKQGGLATQEADAIAEHIAAAAGVDLTPRPFTPVLRGRLMTGGVDRFLRYAVAGGDGGGEASDQELWWPPAKVSGRYLSPWLALHGVGPADAAPPQGGIDVELELTPHGVPARKLELEPLGPLATGR